MVREEIRKNERMIGRGMDFFTGSDDHDGEAASELPTIRKTYVEPDKE